jgi:hypothetical protein
MYCSVIVPLLYLVGPQEDLDGGVRLRARRSTRSLHKLQDTSRKRSSRTREPVLKKLPRHVWKAHILYLFLMSKCVRSPSRENCNCRVHSLRRVHQECRMPSLWRTRHYARLTSTAGSSRSQYEFVANEPSYLRCEPSGKLGWNHQSWDVGLESSMKDDVQLRFAYPLLGDIVLTPSETTNVTNFQFAQASK